MSTGTSSLRRTKRRGAALVAACAAALVAALAGPAWAGSVPQPDDPPAGPRGLASPQIAEAPTKASSPEARTTPAAGTEASTPTPDAPLAAQTTHATPRRCTHGRRQDEQGHGAGAGTGAGPTSTATPQPAPTYGSTTTVRTATHAPVADSARRAAPPRPKRHRAQPASATKQASPAPAVVAVPRDGNRLGLPIGTLTLSSVASDQGRTAMLAAAALLLAAAGAGGLVVGVAGRRLARIT